MNLASIARALGGVVSGAQVLAPGPGHSPHDRSLAVFLDPNAPDLFRVHSHAGDDWRTCRDYVKQRLGIVDEPRRDFRPRVERRAPAAEPDNRDRIVRARTIFDQAGPLIPSPASAFLERRGVDFAAVSVEALHAALRWHPACPWEDGRHGCMVALFTDTRTGEPKAIHRTAISPAGEKIGRKVLGPMAGCVIRLWPDEMVIDGLVVGEGLETVLVAATRIEHRGTRLQPAWATGSAGSMARFPVLAGIESLTLLVDNDNSGTGQKAAEECSARWTAAGAEVFRLVPKVAGVDFADIAECSNG